MLQSRFKQTKKALWKEVLLVSLLSSLVLCTQLPMQRVALVSDKIRMGLKDGGDGVRGTPLPLVSWSCSFPLQPQLALLLSPAA